MTKIQVLTLLLAAAAPGLARHGSQRPGQMPGIKPRSNTPFDDDFGAFVDSVLADFKVPGMSIAVVDGNETFAKGYGYATLPDVAATPETLWLGASTTKAFVGATLSQFVNNESYPDVLAKGWATPMSSVIAEDFFLADDWATQHLTLDDAISHRTGLPRHDYAWRYTTNGSHTPVRDVVRNLRNLPLTAEPRTAYQYCNVMYMVLSHVIETLTKKPLQATFKELIWGPLKMTSTFMDVAEAKASPNHLATGYYWDNATQSYGAIVHDTLQESGAAGIITSVTDHAKWMHSLLYETGPLSSATHADIRRPRFISRAEPSAGMDMALYGLGWQRTTFHGEPLYQHSGESLSFGTTIYWLPERKYGVVAMGNVYMHANMAGEVIVRKLVEDMMGIDQDKRFDQAKQFKKKLSVLDGEFAGAVDEMYPKRPEKKLPPSASLGDLAGEYYDKGYGRMAFKPAGGNDSLVLVAERHDMVYQYNVRLEHVTGDDWLAFFESAVHSRLPAQYFRTHFKVDGKVSGLEMEFGDGTPGTQPYNVTFNKVA